MKLTPCPACRTEIAPNAKSCPRCGFDLKEESRHFLIYLLVVAALLVIVMARYGVFEKL